MVAKNPYNAAAQEIGELFSDFLEGDFQRPALAISQEPLPETARNAIEKSLEAFGFGGDACTFATISLRTPASNEGNITLDPHALFLLIEGMDPLYIICADASSTFLLGEAYRERLALDEPARVFGRQSLMFENLSDLVSTERGKQKAWALFKIFP